MNFKEYKSKPIIRKAYQIKPEDTVVQLASNTYRLSDSTLKFCAYENVQPGDYIVFLNDDDVYHCNQEVFKERNIVDG